MRESHADWASWRKCGTMLVAAAALLCGVRPNAIAQSSGGSGTGLAALPDLIPDAQSRMVSPENPTGEKGKGAMASPSADLPFSTAASELGQGWKVQPFLKLAPHSTTTIMDVEGPGTIEHIWMATMKDFRGIGRATVLRFYWDDETSPSVEVPLSDFFAIGNDKFAPVNSATVVDVPAASMNCYWPMPFRKHARVTVTNDTEKPLPLFTWQIAYGLGPVPAKA